MVQGFGVQASIGIGALFLVGSRVCSQSDLPSL